MHKIEDEKIAKDKQKQNYQLVPQVVLTSQLLNLMKGLEAQDFHLNSALNNSSSYH